MDKREARREFKARKPSRGVFAVRCTASGEAWVSASHNLAASRTGLWFCLRNGMHHNQELQAAWNRHGGETFEFEVVETFEEDVPQLLLQDLVRDRQKHWKKQLGASLV